jgi:hypothetical protein
MVSPWIKQPVSSGGQTDMLTRNTSPCIAVAVSSENQRRDRELGRYLQVVWRRGLCHTCPPRQRKRPWHPGRGLFATHVRKSATPALRKEGPSVPMLRPGPLVSDAPFHTRHSLSVAHFPDDRSKRSSLSFLVIDRGWRALALRGDRI